LQLIGLPGINGFTDGSIWAGIHFDWGLAQGLHCLWSDLTSDKDICTSIMDHLGSLNPCSLGKVLLVGIVEKTGLVSFSVIEHKTFGPSKTGINLTV
jgi:hypothetical protein